MKRVLVSVAVVSLFALSAMAEELPRDAALRTVGELQVDLVEIERAHSAFVSAANSALAMAAKVSQSANSVVAAAANVKRTDELLAQIKQMQELNASFSMQYLQLQQKMQEESRQFTAISNIMKTKHDTAKNSINNIR